MNQNIRISSNRTGKMCINWYTQGEMAQCFYVFNVTAANISATNVNVNINSQPIKIINQSNSLRSNHWLSHH